MFEDEEQKKSGKFVATLECHTPTGQFVMGNRFYKLVDLFNFFSIYKKKVLKSKSY